jgi:ABC-type sugar transport system permease subunit
MAGVPTVLHVALVWLTALASIALAFTSWDGIGFSSIKWVGLENFRQLFTENPQFWPAVQHNAIWLGVFIVFATPLGMLFAVILDRNIRGSRIYQSLLFLPVMLSLALIGIIWELIYSPNFGLINTIIGHNHNDNLIDWLGNPHLNLWALLVEASWRQAPYVMVLYLAGLKAVDPSLREAALMDGANSWQTFWRVVFPTMRPINIVVLVVTVIESLRAFDLVYITSNGNPLRGLELLSVAVTQNIVGETQRIGFGSTLGVVLLVISLVPISIFLYQAFRREEQR